jgi:hypothetical protein
VVGGERKMMGGNSLPRDIAILLEGLRERERWDLLRSVLGFIRQMP